MDVEEQLDEWNPSFEPDSLLKTAIVNFNNNHIHQNIDKYNEAPDTFIHQPDSDEEPADNNPNIDNLIFQSNCHQQPTETLYDPIGDQLEQQWTSKNLYKNKVYQRPLGCPGCFSQVCYSYSVSQPSLDAQHYSSKDVKLCYINYEKIIREDRSQKNNQRYQKRFEPKELQRLGDQQLGELEKELDDERDAYRVYFGVNCEGCNHQLGLYDADSFSFILLQVI